MIEASVVPLGKGHAVDEFCSGDDGLDTWLHRSARPMGGEGLNKTHLWVDDRSGEILGFFALAPTIVTTNPVLDTTAPAMLLAKLALCEDLRGGDPPAGDQLLIAVFETALAAADLIGGKFLASDTQHERARRFYLRNRFEAIEGDDSRLIIKVSAIRRTLA